VNGQDIQEVATIEAVKRCKHAVGDAQTACKIRKYADVKMVGIRDRAQGAVRRECLGLDWWDKEAKCFSCTTKKQHDARSPVGCALPNVCRIADHLQQCNSSTPTVQAAMQNIDRGWEIKREP
jgi:hypothetical protein